MSYVEHLPSLTELTVNQTELLTIKRNELVPLIDDQYQLNHYADHIVQAQAKLLNGVDPTLTQQLAESIEQLIQALNQSKKHLKKRKFNALQKWLGIDLEYRSGQVEYYKILNKLLDRANHLSQKLHIELKKSQSRLAQLFALRGDMATYVIAAQEFLQEYPSLSQTQYTHFTQRLSKKINTLQTLQASNDIVILQMQLSQQMSLILLDRFKEAEQVLIPAWRYHVEQSQSQSSNSKKELDQLDNSREDLIKTLRKSLQNLRENHDV